MRPLVVPEWVQVFMHLGKVETRGFRRFWWKRKFSENFAFSVRESPRKRQFGEVFGVSVVCPPLWLRVG
jgi:hypothetical protein